MTHWNFYIFTEEWQVTMTAWRASSEPASAQEAALLRAAAQAENTRKEQLLRAAGGQKQQ